MERQEELCAEVNKRAPSILESGEWSDCKFVVGAEPDQVVVGGYKLVMAMASSVFEAMFYGSLAETRDHIPIVDVVPEIFQLMLRYIYTGNINLSSSSEASQLYYTAKKYMLHHLMEKCSEYLHNNLNLGNVYQVYEHSQLFEDEALSQKCINIFTENTKELLQDSSFQDAALSTVEKIFSLNELNIDSETDLINAAALYVSAKDDNSEETKSNTSSLETDEEEEVDVMNLEINLNGLIETQNATEGSEQATAEFSGKINDTVDEQQIRSIVKNIRLLTLTPQQYADCTARSSLLTPAEDVAVLVNLVSNKPKVPMPSRLSTSRVRRDKVGKARSEATFRYTMQNISSSDDKEMSPVFYVRNLPWQIEAKPIDKEGIKYLAVFVCCKTESNLSFIANVQLRLICHKPGAGNVEKKFQNPYNLKCNSWGYYEFVRWDTMLDPTQGYIQNDAITIEVHVAAEEPQVVL